MNALKFNHKEQPIGKTSTLFKRAMTHIRIILPLLVLLTGLVISYLSWNVANKKRENELRSYFEYHARDVNDIIVQRVMRIIKRFPLTKRRACIMFVSEC